jgi:hypothetical protein
VPEHALTRIHAKSVVHVRTVPIDAQTDTARLGRANGEIVSYFKPCPSSRVSYCEMHKVECCKETRCDKHSCCNATQAEHTPLLQPCCRMTATETCRNTGRKGAINHALQKQHNKQPATTCTTGGTNVRPKATTAAQLLHPLTHERDGVERTGHDQNCGNA